MSTRLAACFPDSLWPQQSSGNLTHSPWPQLLSCLPYGAQETLFLPGKSLHCSAGLFKSTQWKKLQGKNWEARTHLLWLLCIPLSIPLPLQVRGPKSYENIESWCFLFLNRGKGGVGGRGILAVGKAPRHALMGRTHPASKDNSSLVLGPTTSLSHRKGIRRSQGADYCPTIFSQEEM